MLSLAVPLSACLPWRQEALQSVIDVVGANPTIGRNPYVVQIGEHAFDCEFSSYRHGKQRMSLSGDTMASLYANFGRPLFPISTVQSHPIPGRETEMEPNNAGGYGFILDKWERLNRFLILGSEGGTYYVNAPKLTEENATAVIECIRENELRVVREAHSVNITNRAPKTDQQLFVMALVLKYGSTHGKTAVRNFIPTMLRTGTHLLHFVDMIDSLGGWNRAKRRIVSSWFNDRGADQLAFQCLKYQSRDGWSMRDVIRMAHVRPRGPSINAVLAWATGKLGDDHIDHLPDILVNFLRMCGDLEFSDDTSRAVFGIENGLPREALPTAPLADPVIQAMMLPKTPIHALLRNLGNFTASGMLANPKYANIAARKIADGGALKEARVHPFAIMLAALVYSTGAGVRGNKTWEPARPILDALEDAYDMAFTEAPPTQKRILIGVDISGSMSAPCIGTPIPSSTAAAAMAITLARNEPYATVVQFNTEVQALVSVTKRTSVLSISRANGGGTDLSAPIRWALKEDNSYDAFVILTDNETWAGSTHSAQVLDAYRQKMNKDARLIVCAMAANGANIVDPRDPLSMGCAGLDANLPSIVTGFLTNHEAR